MSMMTLSDVAAMFGVHPDTIKSWIRRGTLRAIRVNNRYRIQTEDAEQLWRDSAVSAPKQPPKSTSQPAPGTASPRPTPVKTVSIPGLKPCPVPPENIVKELK
jgi:excisionase family DNA binding protein